MMGHPQATPIMRDYYGDMERREKRRQKVRDAIGAGMFVIFIASVEGLSRLWGV